MTFKNFGDEVAYNDLKRKMLDDVGLLQEPALIIKFEGEFSDFLVKKRKELEDKARGVKGPKTYGSR